MLDFKWWEILAIVFIALILLFNGGFWVWLTHWGGKKEKAEPAQTSHERTLYLNDSTAGIPMGAIKSIHIDVTKSKIILNSENSLEFSGSLRIE
jgi:hypothetical protein